ncbi:conserved hypothetical protein [Histoplasma capsulatum H143]|uniref:RRM domain-containing protein n=1 Tax=Ajellomyces capsulatus (strain H143) TaxID=544712 RepID=C6HRU6_AJECH|nr:conserved hypothetical protein [Histoplasma capsulatum H143]
MEEGSDLKTAVEKLDGREFKGSRVLCTQDIQSQEDRQPRDPYRSRSPGRRGGYHPYDDYDRRGPPRSGYSPRNHYRERSPARRDYYDRDGYGRRTPPPRSRVDDYPPPPRRPYDDPYDPRGPPPPPRHYDDPYAPRPYGRPRSPPPRGDYGYERRPYW